MQWLQGKKIESGKKKRSSICLIKNISQSFLVTICYLDDMLAINICCCSLSKCNTLSRFNEAIYIR